MMFFGNFFLSNIFFGYLQLCMGPQIKMHTAFSYNIVKFQEASFMLKLSTIGRRYALVFVDYILP